MIYRIFLVTLILCCLTMTKAMASQNPFLPFFFQFGGCTRDIGFGKPPIIGGKFLGKKMEDWDSDDVRMFKDAVEECVRLSGRHETNAPSVYIDNMLYEVSQARVRKQQRERQMDAQREAERQDAEQRRVDDATSEVRSFYNHVMSPAELERAEQIRSEFPTLSARIEGLISAQEHLKQQAEEQLRLEREREDAARKLDVERQKRDLAERLAAEEAKIDAEKKQENLDKNLPLSCKEAQSTEIELQNKKTKDKIDKAESLAEAGDTQTACPILADLSSKLESIRVNLINCTKDLEKNNDLLAQQTASTALTDAIGIHGKQKDLAQRLHDLKCE